MPINRVLLCALEQCSECIVLAVNWWWMYAIALQRSTTNNTREYFRDLTTTIFNLLLFFVYFHLFCSSKANFCLCMFLFSLNLYIEFHISIDLYCIIHGGAICLAVNAIFWFVSIFQIPHLTFLGWMAWPGNWCDNEKYSKHWIAFAFVFSFTPFSLSRSPFGHFIILFAVNAAFCNIIMNVHIYFIIYTVLF